MTPFSVIFHLDFHTFTDLFRLGLIRELITSLSPVVCFCVGYSSHSFAKGVIRLVYITVRQSPIYHQMTLEEFLFQNFQAPAVVNANMANTKTYEYEYASEQIGRAHV